MGYGSDITRRGGPAPKGYEKGTKYRKGTGYVIVFRNDMVLHLMLL